MDEKAEVMGARKGLTEEQKMRHAVRGMCLVSPLDSVILLI